MGIIKFFHQLFRPNCECNVCATPKCDVCEELRMQINYLRDENRRLLDSIIVKPEVEKTIQETEKKPIPSSHIAWRIKQQMLEAEDRKKMQILREKEAEKKINTLTTEELEKELGIPEQPTISESA